MMLHQRGVVDQVMILPGRLRRPESLRRRSCTRPSRPSLPTARCAAAPALAGMVLAVDAAVSPDGAHRVRVVGQRHQSVQLQYPSVTPTRVFVTDTVGRHGRRDRLPAGRDQRPVLQRRRRRACRRPSAAAVGRERAGGSGIAASRGGSGTAGDPSRCSARMRNPIRPCRRWSASRSRSRSRATARWSCSRASPRCWRSPAAATIALSADEPGRHRPPGVPRQRGRRHRLRVVPRRGRRRRAGLELRLHRAPAARSRCRSGCAAPSRSTGAATRPTSTQLMQDVFVGRMSGPPLASDQTDAAADLDRQPAAAAPDRARGCRGGRARARAVQRHRHASAASSATRAPASPTTQTVDVGTGGVVPGAVAARHRHARAVHAQRLRPDAARSLQPVLRRRQTRQRWITSSPAQLSDSIAYLESI